MVFASERGICRGDEDLKRSSQDLSASIYESVGKVISGHNKFEQAQSQEVGCINGDEA